MEQKTAPTSAEPSCGKCGYCVRGLESFTCPECGSDLREVGIHTSRRKWWKRAFLWALLWTVVLPVPAIALSCIIWFRCLPVVYEVETQREIFCMYPQLSARLTVEQHGLKTYWGRLPPGATVPATSMTVEKGQDTNGRMTINLVTGAYSFAGPKGAPVASRGFGEKALLQWFAAEGFDATDPAVQAGAADVIKCIKEMPSAQGKLTRFSIRGASGDIAAYPTSTHMQGYVSDWSLKVVAWSWVGIWVVGICIIMWRRWGKNLGARDVGL